MQDEIKGFELLKIYIIMETNYIQFVQLSVFFKVLI